MAFKQAVARRVLSTLGWSALGERPTEPRFVLIAAPHTTNWDLPMMLLYSWYFELPISWVGKHTLFLPPYGWLMKAMGGIPVDRRGRNNFVESVAELFRSRERLVLAVPAEGTRARTEHWKSGFYWIAKEAGVPIVLGTIDYGNKRGGFGPTVWPTADLRADMDRIRAFYADKIGLYHENFGPVRLKDEETTADPAVSPQASPPASGPAVSPQASPPASGPAVSPQANPPASGPAVSPQASPPASGPAVSPQASPAGRRARGDQETPS